MSRHLSVFRKGLFPLLVGIAVILTGSGQPLEAQSENVRLTEPFTDATVMQVQAVVRTQGKVLTAKTGGGNEELQLQAKADFQFRSQRLPAAGRDARALREIREFSKAELTTTVSGYETRARLPADRQLIVADGQREGLLCHSPEGAMSREAADLVVLPGDPLTLLALLPMHEVAPGEEWTPPLWAAQMLTGIEALETAELTCKLDESNGEYARVKFSGPIKGQRLGTNTTITVDGQFLFDLKRNLLTQARTSYRIEGDVGAVDPGLNVTVTSEVTRQPSTEPGRLTREFLESLPLDPQPEALDLTFRAGTWGLELQHERDWHLFHAVLDGGAPVAILRLMVLGSFIAQCNLSPAPSTSPGEYTPVEQFEADIQRSLGDRFGEIVTREKIPLDDGRQIFRVVVSGNTVIKSTKGRADVPMTWIYYLVANPDGRQASFVFSVESSLLEQLADRDRRIVENLTFTAVQNAEKNENSNR